MRICLAFLVFWCTCSARRFVRSAPNVLFYKPWTNGIVYYTSSLPQYLTNRFEMAIDAISAHSCIKFVKDPSKLEKTVLGRLASGCGHSDKGMEPNRATRVGPDCLQGGTMAHELIHLLGVEHTQFRKDRDRYVYYTGHPEYKMQDIDNENFGVPYEYGSIMHHPPTGAGIRAYDGRYQSAMGQRVYITYYDYLSINRFYNCTERCKNQLPCQNFGYPNPRNCDECNCPPGFGGKTCAERATSCGSTVRATDEWQTLKGKLGHNLEAANSLGISECFHWIEAPPGKGVVVEVQKFITTVLHCNRAGMEFLVDDDIRMSGVRVCTPFEHPVLTTKKSRLPIRVYTNVLFSFESTAPQQHDIQEYSIRYKIAS